MEFHNKIAKAIATVWEDKDYRLLQETLSSNTEWYEGPFKAPLTSIGAVVEQWQKDLANQRNIDVNTEVLAFDGSMGIYRFHASWEDDIGSHELDGIFKVILDDEGKIKYFCQWWSEKA